MQRSLHWRCLVLALSAPFPAGAGQPVAAAMPPLALHLCPDGGVRLQGGACIRLGGRLRVEAGATSFVSRLTHRTGSGLGTVGSVSVDVRVPTELGPVRTYIRLQSASGGLGR